MAAVFFAGRSLLTWSGRAEEVTVLGSFVPLAQETGGNPASLLIFLVLMFVLFYFLMIRPQQRRARAQRELLGSLEEGDEVVTIGGMFGTITALDDERATLEVAPNVEIEFVRTAIARKLVFDEDGEQEVEETEPEEERAGGAGEEK
jgi:preprotein translocase subunit YajC